MGIENGKLGIVGPKETRSVEGRRGPFDLRSIHEDSTQKLTQSFAFPPPFQLALSSYLSPILLPTLCLSPSLSLSLSVSLAYVHACMLGNGDRSPFLSRRFSSYKLRGRAGGGDGEISRIGSSKKRKFIVRCSFFLSFFFFYLDFFSFSFSFLFFFFPFSFFFLFFFS
jgi:hypothetical protein